MKITIFGAGAIGSAVAQHLVNRENVETVQICDARAGALRSLHDTVDSSKLRSFQADARDPAVIAPILEGSDCVVGCADSSVNKSLAIQSIEMGCHFCDQGGPEDVVRWELSLVDKAREAGCWILPNCGLAPGLVNILCLKGIELFEQAHSARLRVGDVPTQPTEPFRFRVSWSAEKLIDDYTNKAPIIRDGERLDVPALSGVEKISFGDEFADLEAFYTSGSVSTLAESLAGKVRTFDMKTIRWSGHASQMAFLLGLGLGEQRTIDVRTHLTYRDVLVRRMRKVLGNNGEDAVLLRVIVTGEKDGRVQSVRYEMLNRSDPQKRMSAMRRSVSVPTSVVAYLLASGQLEGGGAAPPEFVVPKDTFCSELEMAGLNIVTTWEEGEADISHP